MASIEHGGNLAAAIAEYGGAAADWLDLSTGISPHAYPLPAIPAEQFARLPYPSAELLEAAQRYYGHDALLPVPGTQAAIELLPQCLPDAPVLLPANGYQEHRAHWQHNDMRLIDYDSLDAAASADAITQALTQHDGHLLVINPNNPTGVMFAPEQLLRWASALRDRRYLIVDEAFIDVTPERSLLTLKLPDNIVVLRSFGKFFGLAGIRLGAVAANTQVLNTLQQRLLTWGITGPTQYIGARALADTHWQRQARAQIRRSAVHTQAILAPLFKHDQRAIALPAAGLFHSVVVPRQYAEQFYRHCCHRALLVRKIPLTETQSAVHRNEPRDILRFGLVAEDRADHSARLASAISSFRPR